MNGERVCFDGEKWSVKGFDGMVGQAHCDGGIVDLITQLRTVYGLVVDEEHPLEFAPNTSKWVVVCIPDNGRDKKRQKFQHKIQ